MQNEITPPLDRVQFKWVFSALRQETYSVCVDSISVGNMCKIDETIWRIDSFREERLVSGLGKTSDEM